MAGFLRERLVVVGLGNPGSQYESTRHNVGFVAADYILSCLSSPTRYQTFNGEVDKAAGSLEGVDVILLKPLRYMNRSGSAISEFCRYFKIGTEELIVLHDELDLDPGVLKLKSGGSAAGHRGLEDIARVFGPAFMRVRIGIGHPRRAFPGKENYDVVSWVLSRPPKPDEDAIEKVIKAVPDIFKVFLVNGFERAQQKAGAVSKETRQGVP